jgi:hypothetical protein
MYQRFVVFVVTYSQISPTCLLIRPTTQCHYTIHTTCCLLQCPQPRVQHDRSSAGTTGIMLPAKLAFQFYYLKQQNRGNRRVVSHCCSGSFRFATRLIVLYYLTFCLVMDYPHFCKTRAACVQTIHNMHTS